MVSNILRHSLLNIFSNCRKSDLRDELESKRESRRDYKDDVRDYPPSGQHDYKRMDEPGYRDFWHLYCLPSTNLEMYFEKFLRGISCCVATL